MRRATARVVFWRSLLEAQATVLAETELSAARRLVANELDAAAELALRSQQVRVAPLVDDRPRNVGRKVLFLYRPPRAWIWLIRACFYYYALYSLVGIPIVASQWSGGGRSVFHDSGVIAGLATWLVLLWWLVRYIERMSIKAAMREQSKVQDTPESAAEGQ
jgi:hypothetical protein